MGVKEEEEEEEEERVCEVRVGLCVIRVVETQHFEALPDQIKCQDVNSFSLCVFHVQVASPLKAGDPE
ncbi:hypothetical protein E2C01_054781 [Portunus trituberculatus]|uniref:Uncharacterized protein n=1 Tax=Portunus trituberculatus TaxID=210409 RepID=A0A5B7GTL6_PORTR|nr:hypothetical protein [Portunus trituberculatus]